MTSLFRATLLQVGYGDDESLADRVDRVCAWIGSLPDTDLVILPELWAHGGFASGTWAAQAESIDGTTIQRLSRVASQKGIWLHGGSIIERAAADEDQGPDGRGLWNTSVLLDPAGAVQLTYRKIHRFGFGEGEPRLLEAGQEIAATDAVLRSRHTRLGLATCYDLRFPELFRQLTEASAEVLLVPAAWPLPRVEHWRLLGRARAVENQAWVLQCNTAGTHSGTTMGGHSQVIDPTGEVVAELGVDEGSLTVDLDLDLVAQTRHGFPVLADRRIRIGGGPSFTPETNAG
ncbi:hydrolase [Flexivirga endophytica]|uniref:Hydrolase n=1 Tax=Flexivirga endophytica TaxID=1849103 RepID=A0A916SZI8_9MICO|nr:carbon-nitrogen family hydrolase [Flexivirga endophytica]GGB21519.1 hydrolase [Flexivirga endophytica]GHB59159.1 hydrolase [Flexivirga endophytica]